MDPPPEREAADAIKGDGKPGAQNKYASTKRSRRWGKSARFLNVRGEILYKLSE
jgi:hypothetical protein